MIGYLWLRNGAIFEPRMSEITFGPRNGKELGWAWAWSLFWRKRHVCRRYVGRLEWCTWRLHAWWRQQSTKERVLRPRAVESQASTIKVSDFGSMRERTDQKTHGGLGNRHASITKVLQENPNASCDPSRGNWQKTVQKRVWTTKPCLKLLQITTWLGIGLPEYKRQEQDCQTPNPQSKAIWRHKSLGKIRSAVKKKQAVKLRTEN